VRDLYSNPIVQTVGLDASGSRLVHLDASSSDNRIEDNAMSTPQLKPIAAEQILGKREEVYWEKVSEKVRRQAVEKALSYLHGSDECGVASSVHALEGNEKRRKK
jgi:xRRM domain